MTRCLIALITKHSEIVSDHGTHLAFLAEKWSGENGINWTGGTATVAVLTFRFGLFLLLLLRK